MTEIAIEYVILVPLLLLQIFLFPFAVSLIMNTWVTSSRELALQDAASQLGSSIQQLYVSLNHLTVTTGTVTSEMNIPSSISGYVYRGNASLTAVSGSNSDTVLNLTLKFLGLGQSATTLVTLGPNAEWQSSTFMSNSTTACISANKDSSGTIWLSFGA